MINHSRTLLFNRARLSVLGAGEEYVPADYVPVTLTPALAAARETLFGAGSDRFGENITLARLLTIAHANPALREVVLEADDRITYGTPYPAVPENSVAGPAGAVLGVPSSPFPGQPGRGSGMWTITLASGGSSATIDTTSGRTTVTPTATESTLGFGRVIRREFLIPPAVVDRGVVLEQGSLVVTGPLGANTSKAVVYLPGSGVSVTLPLTGGVWVIQVYTAPSHPWTGVASYGLWRDVFSGREPEDTILLGVWRAGPAGYDRAAAFALALARRIDALR